MKTTAWPIPNVADLPSDERMNWKIKSWNGHLRFGIKKGKPIVMH